MTDFKPTYAFARWYLDHARPLLEQIAQNRLPEFDERLEALHRLLEASDDNEVAVCFLGAAGVGKSTLLNALVSETRNVLPHGGVGSLTAQATVLRHAAQPCLTVAYFPGQTLRGILLLLETAYSKELKRQAASEDVRSGMSEEDILEVESELSPEEARDRGEGAGERVEAYWRQVRLMIQGDQRGTLDMPYLLDGLRAALALKPRWDRTLVAADSARAARIREYLGESKEGASRSFVESQLGAESFMREVWDHASGFLAPNIRHLELGWNAEIVREGLVLVDLPGIGIANDEYRRVTHEWINKRARAIVLVVGARGVTESDAELLRQTGFFNRFLHDGDDPDAPPVTLAVVVVRVDEAATVAWQREKAEARGQSRSWVEHFAEQCQRAEEMVRAQVGQELGKLEAAGNDTTRTEREAAMKRVLATLQVHPVSAPQYRAFHLADEEEPAKIKREEDSNIPRLKHALLQLGADHRARHRRHRNEAIERFANSVRAQLELDRATWEQDQRADREAEALRKELDAFLEPRRRELEARQGAFREFLRNGVPEQIDARVAEAALAAQTDITKYLGRMRDLHWASLKASVTKHGRHRTGSGRQVDLPNELTLRFEEPVAVVWSKHILSALRKRTSELGADYVKLVGEVVDWARTQEARVSPRVVEKLHESMIADTKGLNAVGKDAVDELKKKVRDQLYSRLEKRITECCASFVARRAHEGPGVKSRILEFFRDELATDVVTTARPIAKQVLATNYAGVQTEIVELFQTYKNPLDRARDALITSHEEGVRRSDAQKRRKVLDAIASVLQSMPEASR